MSYDAAERRHTPLGRKLAQRIHRSGPITVRDYMSACLSDPEHGYYRHRAGVGADFVTAPEISQMFGELIGLWCAVVWQQMDKPHPVRLVELGPGRGSMMRDMLSAVRVAPDFAAALNVHLVEASGPLMAEQRLRLREVQVPLGWSDDMTRIPAGSSIVVANEFLDALPRHQYVPTEGGWAERTVDIDVEGRLQFGCAGNVDMEQALLLTRRFPGAQVGDIVEAGSYPVLGWLAARALQHATVALFLDYGHMRSDVGDTLQAVRQHRPEHPLCSPGEADLTMHVDFAAVAAELTQSGALTCDGPTTQSEFLGALGLIERASRLMAANPARALEIETAAQRLLAPAGMGARFKVLGVRSAHLPPLPGLLPPSS